MQLGVSTSCFFPLETEKALTRLGQAGVTHAELFLNTLCESEPAFIRQLQKICQTYGISVPALHPFTSGMETLYFASAYPRRVADGIKLYRRLFECTTLLGAHIFTMHGEAKNNPGDFSYYCENFAKLSEIAAADYDITLCQENVVRCKCGSSDTIRRMRELLGDQVHFTLDVKQAVRSGEDVFEMLDAMDSNVAHVHISDHTVTQDCLPPGRGEMDYPAFFRRLQQLGFDGSVILELYRENFSSDEELTQSCQFLQNTLQRLK